jgi:hypothetical protein
MVEPETYSGSIERNIVIKRVIATCALTASLAVAGLMGAGSALATPTAGGKHCLLSPGGLSCYASAEDVHQVAPAAQYLVTVWSGYNQQGPTSRSIYGPTCSEDVGNIDYYLGLGPVAGIGSSVTKHSGSNCNWQLEGPNGGRSTWVEGSRDNLANLGDGWDNRAVNILLT